MNAEARAIMQNSLRDQRHKAVTLLVGEFMEVLSQSGYSLEDLLEGLANWVYQDPKLDRVVYFLENARSEIEQ
ncbi:hypothetical protein WA1_18940 [Scytonema hofmannii PCC 7110]|uniref:Uncharacterized protein n=1 Tax=Scytonema hofmannii PCC 7110 TaxID=128403 RepID=A0A139XBK1_9CYAN|nr:hypothetical protein [Scytonema hofmannii]KYC42080.1 hypothetical protein WA1_18940 [Scytonema hofmannii PCC 7110]